jgi:hypothetical protein
MNHFFNLRLIVPRFAGNLSASVAATSGASCLAIQSGFAAFDVVHGVF